MQYMYLENIVKQTVMCMVHNFYIFVFYIMYGYLKALCVVLKFWKFIDSVWDLVKLITEHMDIKNSHLVN